MSAIRILLAIHQNIRSVFVMKKIIFEIKLDSFEKSIGCDRPLKPIIPDVVMTAALFFLNLECTIFQHGRR